MIYKEEVGISSDFPGVLNLIWIFSSRGENQDRTFQMEIATKEMPRNIKQHVCGMLREALSNKKAEEKFKDQIWRGICIGRYKMWVFQY